MKKAWSSFLLLFLVTGFVIFSAATAFAGTPTTISALMEVLNEEKQDAVYNIKLNAPFTKETSGIKENISTETGDVIVKNNLFHIPGRNGKDLSLTIEYRSRDAKVYNEGTKSNSTTNNYGGIIIALYDVFDSNNYWLRTEGMKYTTSESSILGEKTINSEKWVFTGYLQYESGTSLLTSGSITNSAREKSIISAAKYIAGEGWSLDIPSLEINGESVYVSLPNGQTYEADFTNGIGLKDYELTDVIFTKDTTAGNGAEPSAYKMYYTYGNKYYFSARGELLTESDRFNNSLSYYWSDYNGLRVLTQIVDSAGRSVKIEYNDTATVFRQGTRSVSLVKTPIPGFTDRYYLSSYIDAAGNVTNYEYTFEDAAFDLLGKTPAVNKYANLVEIGYPTGLKTQYIYEKSNKNLSSSGNMEYFKAKERKDLAEDKVYNLQKYHYYNEPDGYPNYKTSIDELYKYSCDVVDSNGLITKYSYNSNHQLTSKQRYNDRLIDQVITDYHVKYHLPTRNVTKSYNSEGNVREKTDTYEYDYRGNIIAENHPPDTQTTDMDEYKTFYQYDYEYNLLINKRLKQDKDKTVEIKYALSEDKKNVSSESTYRNGKIVSNKLYEHDGYGNIVKMTTAKDEDEWCVTEYNYSPEYKGTYLTAVVERDVKDADGNTKDVRTEFSYDLASGNKISATDGNGNKTSFEYDLLNRTIKENLPDKSSRSYAYNDKENILNVTNASGNKLVYYYTPLGKLAKVVEPIKKTTLAEFEYDENENLLSKVDGNRNTKAILYDEQRRIKEISKKDQAGLLLSRTTVGYDEAMRDSYGNTFNKISVTGKGDGRDNVTNYYFDSFERLVKQGRMAGDKEEFAHYQYDYLGNQTVSINFAGEKVQNEYDLKGKPLKSTDAEGDSTGYAYDFLENPVSITDALGQTSYFEYDRFGHKVIEKSPFDGNRFSTTKYYYDGVGNITRIIDPEGYVTNQSYTERSFLKAVEKVIDSDTSNITQMEYDGEGTIQSIKKGLNSWTDTRYSEETYEYDTLGRRILTKDPEGKETRNEYDNNGNLISVTDRNNLVTSYKYDGLNRVIDQQNSRDGQENAVHITYDLLGNKVQMSDSSGTTLHEYDALNRLVKTNYESGIKQTYEYDHADRITGIKVLQGSLEQIALQNEYNKNGKLKLVTENGRKYSYQYDALGRVVEEYDGLTCIKTAYNYYNSGSIKGMSHVSGETVLDSFNYAYDMRGNQTQKDENGAVTKYYYDPLSRLKTVLSSDDEVLDYKYDDLSNIAGSVEIKDNKLSETSYLYDRNSRLLLQETQQGDRDMEQRFSYDLEGNLKTKEEVIKQSGNLAVSKKTEYIFDGYNRLEKVITPDDRLVEYTYNGDGLRTGKRFDNEAINYYYDRGNIVLETSNNEVTAKNIRGNRLIYRETSSGLYSYLHNAHGDVIKLINENGDVVKDYTFDPYGKEKVKGSNSFGNDRFKGAWQQEVEKIDNPFRYSGEYLDEESGLYYLRARYYDSETMRFISEDSVKGTNEDPLSLNLYTYCSNNPVNFVDPSGNIPTAVEAAEMAEQVYSVTSDDRNNASVSGGWTLRDIKFGSENLKIGVYSRLNAAYYQGIEYALVNKGTTPTSVSDWKNNGQQLFGSSTDMWESIATANYFVDNHSDNEITMVGHSKGGAEAAANAVATKKNCIIFNPATVNLGAYGLDSSNYSASMTAFIVKGDALNTVEGCFSSPIDRAEYLPQQYGGHWYDLWQTSVVDRIRNHMMGAVKEALKEAGYN